MLFALGCDFMESTTVIGDFKITFEPQGGDIGTKDTIVKRGDTIDLPFTSREGYSFDGWNNHPTIEDSARQIGDMYIVSRNGITLYAHWTGDFTVKFDPRRGDMRSEDRSITVARRGAITLPEVNRLGFWFEGWHSHPVDRDLYGETGDEYDVMEDGITMYAHWKSILHMDEGDSVINGIVCVFVEAGTFTMGSPKDEKGRGFDEDQRTVTLTENFWISKYPITNRQLGRDVPQNELDHPAVNITWESANSFAQSKGGLLPTEAQWEFAARGGKEADREYTVYSGGNILADVGWYLGNSDGGTQKAGAKLPNKLGIYDMTGNVKELCRDWYGIPTGEPLQDPKGPESGIWRIYRSCSFEDEAADCRVADRPLILPNAMRRDMGFRVVFIDH